MANANSEKHKCHEVMQKRDRESPLICSSWLQSSNELRLSVDEQFELRWPAPDERDSTQIQGDPTPKSQKSEETLAETLFKHCSEMKVQQKIPGRSEDNKIPEVLTHVVNHDQSSLGPKIIGEKRKITVPSSTDCTDFSDRSQQIDYWNRLSDEIILAIFSLLTRKNVIVCTKVCKRWQRLAYDETLWYSMDLTGASIIENILRKLLMRGVVVMRLAWAEVLSPTANELPESPEETISQETSKDFHYNNLQYLDASSCDIKEKVLLQSISKCKSLKNLSLESCCVSTNLLRIIGGCRHLSVLNLCMCSGLTKAGLSALAKGCTRITELNVSWTNLTPESICQVVKGFPLLIKLNLSGCRETLRDEAIVDLLATCQHLTSLDLSDCIVITELCVKTIVRHGKMEHLSLSRCYGIAPKSLELLSSLKSLQSLQIFGFLTIPGISVLKRALPGVDVNGNMFSAIARPIETLYKKRIWGLKCKSHEN